MNTLSSVTQYPSFLGHWSFDIGHSFVIVPSSLVIGLTMVDPGPRWTLVDRSFRPSDRQGNYELALVLWLELLLEWGERICRWFAARPLTTFLLWAVWLSYLYWALGPASYVKVPDCGNGTLPARMVVAGDFLNGQLGNWMAFSGCGTDRVLNNFRLEPQSVLLGLLPAWLGYGLIILVQRLVAGYFFFRVTRDDLGFEPAAAMLTGLGYSLFHQIGIHWQWDGFTLYDGLGIPSLPLLFWLANRLVERRLWQSVPSALGMGLALGLCAPYFQTIFFPFLALFWYTFIQKAWSRTLLLLLTCVFVGWAVVNVPEMLAAARYVPLSHRTDIVVRSDSPYVKYIENVEQWPGTVKDNNFTYLLVAAAGLLCARLRERRLTATCIAVFAILAFVGKYHFFNDHVLSNIPILSSFHFHRFIYLVPFLCALAMGLGLTAVPKDSVLTLSNQLTALKLNVPQISIVAATAFLLIVSTDTNLKRWKLSWRGENFYTLYRNPELLKLAERRHSEPEFRVACISDLWRPSLGMKSSHMWTFGPGVVWAYGLETTDGYQVLYSMRFKQFWSEVIAPLMSIDDYRARQHVYWGNMLFLWHPSEEKIDQPLRQYYNLELLSLANTKYLISPVPLDDPDLKLLPSEQRKNYLKWEKRGSTSRALAAFKGEWSHRPLYIYENRRCLPRFFLARSVVLYDNPHTLVYELRSREVEWLRNNVQVDRNDLPDGIDLEAIEECNNTSCVDDLGDVKVVSRTSDRIELEFNTARECVLFLSNTWHPSWRATLDGQTTPIFPANHTFQGVYIPSAGKHRAVLRYEAEYSMF